MSKFTRAHQDTLDLASELIRTYHPDLRDTGATFDILMVHPDEDEEGKPLGAAIMHQGYPCGGLARLINLRDRAKGMSDGEIQLDAFAWGDMDDAQRAALLDHELQHFAVKRDKNNSFVFDDLNRPVFRMRLHDRQMGWFDVIAARHAKAAPEIIQARKLLDGAGQLYWPDLGIGELPVGAVDVERWSGKRKRQPA